MKVIFNYATRQFEPMEPSMRERFALGGGVIQGEKVGDRENFAEPISYPTRDYILKKLKQGSDIGEIVRDFAKENNIDIFGGTREDVPKARRNLNAAVRRKIYGGQRMLPDKELVSLLENNIKNSNPDVVQKQFTDFVNKNKNKYLNKKGGTEKLYEDAVKWFKKNNPAGLLTYDGTQVRTLRPGQEVIRLKSGEGSIETSYKRGRQEIREVVSPSEGVGPSKQKSKYARLDEAWEMAADSLNMSTKDYKNLLQKYITRPAQRIIPELTGTKYAAGPEHVYGLRQAIGTSLKKEMIKSATNVSPAPREFNSFIKGPQLDKKVTGMIDNAFNTNDINKRRDIIKNVNNEIKLFAKKFPGTYPKYEVDNVGNIKDVNLNKINLKAKKATDLGTEYIDYLLKTPGFTKSKEYKNLPKDSKDLIDTRKSGDIKKFKELIKGKVDSLRKQGITLFSKLERGSPARKILESIPGAPGKVVDAAVITPFDFFSSIAAGYNLPESVAIAASNLLPKSVQKVLPTTLATYDTQREIDDKFEPVFNLSGGEETKFGKKIREGVGEAIDKIKERFGDDAIGTADDVPESEAAERRRMFEEANERFGDIDEMEISDIDNPFMAAMGGRVGFANGSPNPMEEMATLRQAIASNRGGTELKDQFLYDTSPIGKLDKNIFGKDGDRNLMQQFNTQFLDPRSYPYYAQKTSRGLANIPELTVRFPLAAAYLFGKGTLAFENFKRTGDLSKFSMEDLRTAMEILEPKFTNLVLEGKIGDVLGLSPEAIKAVEEKRTGPQKTTGDLLQFTGEAVGPATPYIFLAKLFPKLPKQIKDLGGGINAADKINKEIERKAAQEGVDQTRRDILIATGSGGAIALLKYLGLDNLFKAAPKAVKATPEIITKGGTPKYFFDFINLVKSKGDDITDKAATIERQKVYDYNGYTVYENLDSGRITVNKDVEGGASYYIGDGEYDTVDGIIRKEEIVYDPPETILDDAGKPKRVPDSYEENTLKPDYDGSDGDVEAGLESIDEVLQLLAKDGKKYNLDELEQMGINPEGLGEDLLKQILRNPEEIKLLDSKKAFKDTINKIKYMIEKAGGGIVKLAGAGSGPPPKSGPTPHGLPYIAKNVRPIKERK